MVEVTPNARVRTGRRPAHSGVVGRRLAREAPEVVSLEDQAAHGVAIAPSGAHLRAPACECLPSGGYFLGRRRRPNGQVRYPEVAGRVRADLAGKVSSAKGKAGAQGLP
jgi:hypothetical protein